VSNAQSATWSSVSVNCSLAKTKLGCLGDRDGMSSEESIDGGGEAKQLAAGPVPGH